MTKLEELEERSKYITKIQKMLDKEQTQLFVLINIEKEKELGQITMEDI